MQHRASPRQSSPFPPDSSVHTRASQCAHCNPCHLSRAIDVLGSDNAIGLTADNTTGVALSAPSAIEYVFGAPFVGIARVPFKVAVVERAGAQAVELTSSFAGQLSIDMLQKPLLDLDLKVSCAGCC